MTVQTKEGGIQTVLASSWSEKGDAVFGISRMIRKLPSLTQSVTIGGVLSNHKVVYTYNADGMITGVRHYYYYNDYYYDSEYIVDGTRVLAYQGGDDRGSFYAEYLYDESGSPIGMRYYAYNFETNQRETECVYYFFEKNVFGDIVGVYDEEGDKVLGFTYDAWGNVSITESSEISSLYEGYGTYLKKACIFRYRGYMYESSSGFYYLQTRFYDSETGRFINADGYVSTGTGLLGYNMYAYCNNNPVMYFDPTGSFVISLTTFLTLVVLTSFIMIPVVVMCDWVLDDLDEISESGALYDSARSNGSDSSHNEQGIWYSVEGGTMKNTEYSAIEASAGFFKSSDSWGIFEFETGLGKISGSVSSDITEGIGVGSSIDGLYGSAKVNIPIGKHSLKIGLEGTAGSVGASAKFGKKTELGIALGIGGKLVIEWD